MLQRAQEAACEAVRPGVPCEAIDAAAREVIDAEGYGERFIHRTGHGIGLETHEEPYIVAGNTEPLAPGFAFSVEPGIYLRGAHGARIEDILVCTEEGASGSTTGLANSSSCNKCHNRDDRRSRSPRLSSTSTIWSEQS